MITPQECVNPCENQSFNSVKSFSEEFISFKKIIPLVETFCFKSSNTLICFLADLSPLALLDKKV